MGIIQKILDRLRGDATAQVEASTRVEVAEHDPTPRVVVAAQFAPDDRGGAEAPVAEEVPAHDSGERFSALPAQEVPAQDSSERSSGVKRVVLAEEGLSVLDLREVPSIRVRIVGTGYWVTTSGLNKHGGHEYLLVREPKNKWDANAVAVYGKGRKVGYVSAGKAAALALILDPLGFDAYRIGGAPVTDNSSRIWADVPTIPKLRSFALSLDEGRG
ncbi:HIRAN domain-containing protein [Arthrobacter sp. CC3]|uniref:HIRAN domain-containing protein n=1 Tax=Arthrobacter sp. CC3 TaxID=3029185 RepID=UPI0032669EA1